MLIIEFTAGKLTKEVKEKLITQLTDVSEEITGIPKHLFFITINEKPAQDIAVGGVSVQKLKDDKQTEITTNR